MLAFRVTNHSCAPTAPEMSLTLCIESAGSSGQAHLQSKAGGRHRLPQDPLTPRVKAEGLLTPPGHSLPEFSELCLSLLFSSV